MLSGIVFPYLGGVAAAVVKNSLLGHAGIGPEAFGRIPGEKLRHSPFHPHIQRKRLQAA